MADLSLSASPPPVPRPVLEALLSPTFRMPPQVRPQHYAIEFQPDAHRHTFAGSAYITLRVEETSASPIRHLILHALDLHIDVSSIRIFIPSEPSSTVGGGPQPAHPSHHLSDEVARRRPFSTEGGSYMECQGLHRSEVSETLLVVFDAPLPRDVGEIFVLIIERFDGLITSPTEMEGLFHSNSADATVLSTHLEPTGARRLFPCFDEPGIQATFQLSVIAAAAHTVLSNTEVEADITLPELPYLVQARQGTGEDANSPRGGELTLWARASTLPQLTPAATPWHCVRFHITPLLHTCIVGFHVGRFALLEQCSRNSGVLCRVVLPHTEAIGSGSFVLDLATKAVDFFEDFFDVRLPLTKLDVVGVETLGVLGMENWGMINLLTDYLVVAETTPLERRQRVARLIGHEICHQWFGDWVSIEWWNCLWLKEGMCRYLEYFFVNAVFPGWGLWNEFLCNIMNSALLADADPRETHPVDCCNSAPRRIYDSFDAISYGKGACVLRMLFSIIGVEWLKRATHLLMVRFAGRAINAKDLGSCIVDTEEEHRSDEEQLRHVRLIHACLRMVEVISHPYLYIHHRPGESYTITQYMPPSKQCGLLVEYLQQQRSKASVPVIDLLSAPARASFEWTPETVLRRVTASFSIPLRAIQWTPGGCSNAHLIFLEETEHHFACPAYASTPLATEGSLLTPFRHTGTGTEAATRAVASSSPTPQIPSESTPFGATSDTWYFNQGGSGFFQCDYDATTWRCLFEHVAAFSEADRVMITMHFINHAKAQIGHQPGDTGDRCTLFLEWLLRLTGTPSAMNSFLWELVTNALTTLVQLVQGRDCHSLMKVFASGLYAPLRQSCALSFFAEEETVSFQSTVHLSRQLVLRILQLLSLCDSPAVMVEAEEMAQRSMMALLASGDSPLNTTNTLASTAGSAVSGSVAEHVIVSMPSGIGQPSDSGVRTVPPLSADIPAMQGSGELLSTTSTPAEAVLLGGAAHSYSCGSVAITTSLAKEQNTSKSLIWGNAAPTQPHSGRLHSSFSPTECGSDGSHLLTTSHGDPASGGRERSGVQSARVQSYPSRGASKFNVDDLTHIQAGSIALSHLVAQGRLDYWMAAAAVAVELLRLDRKELLLAGGAPAPVPQLTNLSPKQRRSVLRLVLPAVFTLDQRPAFPLMAKVFHAVPLIESAAVMRLFHNSLFVAHLLSTWRLTADRRALELLLRYGAEACGNGYTVAQLKMLAQADSTGHTAPRTASVEQYKRAEFAECPHLNGSSPSEAFFESVSPFSSSCTPASERSALRARNPAIAAALDCMESNCVWMDYCCSHYDQFLREQLHGKALQPVSH
ncbi:hypothetical protein LSCM1_07901 [Leishmania martiniquensis]|uniref:Puromycin-sensitive aminopeptidase-like protein n=1 Tax=Leishmania martiniquensis TaxID=1580590 RepID=A0A836HX88_9TRYP|nr:hypothetical protein LSCM1_07901 [Leishmania martiniquensis]